MIRRQTGNQRAGRRGAVLVWLGLVLIPLMIIIGCAIDIGYIMSVRAELQNVADAAAVAGATHLLYDPTAEQDAAVERAQQIASANTAGFIHPILDPAADIDITAHDPKQVDDSVQVEVHRDTQGNGSLVLFFGGFFEQSSQPLSATATAVLVDNGGGGGVPNAVRLRQ